MATREELYYIVIGNGRTGFIGLKPRMLTQLVPFTDIPITDIYPQISADTDNRSDIVSCRYWLHNALSLYCLLQETTVYLAHNLISFELRVPKSARIYRSVLSPMIYQSWQERISRSRPPE